MRFLIQVGPLRLEVAFDVARLTPDVAPDSTIARLERARF